MKEIALPRLPFDAEDARQIIDAFSFSSDISCKLLTPNGEERYGRSVSDEVCRFCRTIPSTAGALPDCGWLHRYGGCEAERIGGRYIYFCEAGLAWCAAPILVGGQLAASLMAGPILIMDVEDFLAGDVLRHHSWTEEELTQLVPLLNALPQKPPAVLSHVSTLLLAAALYISDSSAALWSARNADAQQQSIGEELQQLKLPGAVPPYPLDKERELVRAIAEGEQATARERLNELLGYIFFSTGGDFSLMRTRSVELMTVLSRAATDGGADFNQVLAINHRFFRESEQLHNAQALTMWLNRLLDCYTQLVFGLGGAEHKDIIYKALHYMKQNYQERLTLDDVARHVGFSPSYLSRVFKAEIGCTFHHYLTDLRMERGKVLLLTTGLSISEICADAGFEDQSYFTKVFCRYTGTTPNKYRKKQGKLDTEKERSH